MIIATALFIFGIILITSYLRGQNSKIERGNDYVKVYVAQKDIPAGTSATAIESGGFIRQDRVLRRDAAPRPIYNISDVSKLSLNQTVYAGEQLSAYKFGAQSSLMVADQLKGSLRVFSVHLKPSGTAGLSIKPGDHVDIQMSRNDNGVVTTQFVARDVAIMQTPDSMAAQLSQNSTPTTSPDSLKANGDPTLWMLMASDATSQAILWGQAAADGDGLQFQLRGSTTATDTKLPPLSAAPVVN